MASLTPDNIVHLYPRWQQTGSLHIVFQPLFHLPSGHVFGWEALSRPQIADQPLGIAELLESATYHHELSAFDRRAIWEALHQARARGLSAKFRLFVNIFPETLYHPDWVIHAVHHAGLSPEQIVLELSERESLPEGHLDQLLAPFRAQGMAVALDDFGAGYSGLNRLVEMHPEYAKIDITLVRHIDSDHVKHALVESTVRFSAETGHIQLLAEGIEREAELLVLHDMGITLGQGYLLGKPEPVLSRPRYQIPPSPPRVRAGAKEQLTTVITLAQRLLAGLAAGEGLIPHLIAALARLLNPDLVIFFRHQGDFLYAEEAHPPLDEKWQRLPVSPAYLSFDALAKRQTIVFQTPEEGVRSPAIHEWGMASGMFVPVYTPAYSWGFFFIGYRIPMGVRAHDVTLAEGIARLMGLGLLSYQNPVPLSNIPLGEPVFEALAALLQSRTQDQLLAKVVDAALSVSGGHLGWIGILRDDELYCITPQQEAFSFAAAPFFDPATSDGQGPVGRTLRNRTTVVIPDILKDASLAPWRDEMIQDGIRSAVGIPLVAGDRVLGLLKVYHSRAGGFDSGHIRRLEALAALATSILIRQV
ncbi:diguanylate cyclase/phosphodiesterase [Sulfobacillus acidophilus TPY]|uniref:Diguanylate phosphodiesterase with GAF sensor(S) n=1 Tax=Sulfobacillus acidophilus (strain ATCC 700253 / DSM 10332 / NAL) TaxID=679936 RepID=G8U095_SULAD|nr:diguanylate cyclase/phosphodiesterase [Sulfobacillus acidophilus TPY]AEW06437.1 diguanylate phosphodiesterase with GAF sensor(s) [Sulfobacillus acidophilus DSM 10332]